MYDKLTNAPVQRTASCAFHMVDVMQDHYQDPGVQVNAAAALFLLLCERFQVSAQDAFTAAKNLMNHADGSRRDEFEAIRLYLKNEVR